MGRIDDAVRTLEGIENGTERALQLAGLISTLFKIKGVALIVTDQLAFHSYTDTVADEAELDLAAFAGELTPRIVLEVMKGQLHAGGSIYHWSVAGIPVRFQHNIEIAHRELCRDFTTDHGVVKLVPVEEITAAWILAAVHPEPDSDAHARAHLLLVNGLNEAFDMNWKALYNLCHQPEYRVGDQLAQMRLEAKREVDAAGTERDHIGATSVLPTITRPEENVPLPSPSGAEAAANPVVISNENAAEETPDK